MLRHLLTAAAVCVLSACASTSSTSPGEAPTGPILTKLTGYFGANPLDGKAVLGPPPAPDSPHGKADRALFDETRVLEGSTRWKTAIQDNDLWGGGALRYLGRHIG